MSLAATVLIPTHDHGPTLAYAAQSALAQTMSDLEVLIVGDGVPDVTREVVRELRERDARVRFFDHPKGPRHGEPYRHQALLEARGRIVCCLADDDLWLPHHIETMERLLIQADYAHAPSLFVDEDNALIANDSFDFARPGHREAFLTHLVEMPLAVQAHTLAAYQRLPRGWHVTPPGIATDGYFAQLFVREPWCRLISGGMPTCIRFPGGRRADWTPEHRLAELQQWWSWVQDPDWRAGFPTLAQAALVRSLAHRHLQARQAKQKLHGLQAMRPNTRMSWLKRLWPGTRCSVPG